MHEFLEESHTRTRRAVRDAVGTTNAVDEDQEGNSPFCKHERMLTLEDCIELSGLTEDEIRVIAQHEHIPQIAAAELGNYLCHSPEGELCIKAMIRDDIERACACANRDRELALKLVLRTFVLQHPRSDERGRAQVRMPERRACR